MGHMSRVGDHLVAVENTPKRHNMIVCTLCSCYPWEVLGLPPVWYKSAPYRSRAVKDPRGVLDDFGVKLPKDTEVRVWDSTAETRFIVLPMRPAGTEGWSEEQARRPGHARLHDRHRPAAQSCRAASDHGRRSRHGRHGRLRQGGSRAERAAVPRALGGPRAGDAARHGLRRRLAHRPLALCAGEAAAGDLSHRVVLPALGAGDGEQCPGARLCHARGAEGRACADRRQEFAAQADA